MLDNFKLPELQKIKELISSYDDINDLKTAIDKAIEEKEEENKSNLNIKLNREMFVKFKIFDPWELKVLDLNGITNLQELIDCNLDELVGMNSSIREKLSWARDFYNMKPLQKPKEKK